MFPFCCAVHLMFLCCVPVDSPVQLRTAPPAQKGLASGVEPEQLWTGSRPAGSPCFLCFPSCTHRTHQTATDEHTHLQLHTYRDTRQQKHVVGHDAGNRDSDQGPSVTLSSCLSLSVCFRLLIFHLLSLCTSCLPLRLRRSSSSTSRLSL